MHPLIEQTLDSITVRGPQHPMPGSEAPEVRHFHEKPPYPAAARLVRFFHAQNDLNEAGLAEHLQDFFDWQRRFFSLGMSLYFLRTQFRKWMVEVVPEILAKPLSPPYKHLLQAHIQKIIKICSQYNEFCPQVISEKPALGEVKESIADIRLASHIFEQHPAVPLAAIVFQGTQLYFLQQLITGIEGRNSLPDTSLIIITEAIERLAINFDSGNFMRPMVWTALSYYARVGCNMDQPLLAQDFAAGWKKVEDKGFSTEMFTEAGTRIVVDCPYRARGRVLAAMELCARTSEKTEPAPEVKQEAHGLWCIYNHIQQQSSCQNGPHTEDLEAIRYAMRSNYVEGHPYFASDPDAGFRTTIQKIHARILQRITPVPA